MNQYETTSVIIPKSKSLKKHNKEIVTVCEIISDLYDENEVYHTPFNSLDDLSLGDQNTQQLGELFKTFNQ